MHGNIGLLEWGRTVKRGYRGQKVEASGKGVGGGLEVEEIIGIGRSVYINYLL